MPFIQDIVKHRSLSIVGMEKNTGKTECLNYILKRLSQTNKAVALTSIGIDGEMRDQVSRTPKPEVTVYEGMTFVTTEKLYKQRQLISEILDVGTRTTSIGRLVTAKALCNGKVQISGSPDTHGLKMMIDRFIDKGIDITIVDGALSRMSLASPAITDAMVLATGAAYSASIPQLVARTKYIYDLINLRRVDNELAARLSAIERGIWAIDDDGRVHDLEIESSYLLGGSTDALFRFGNRIFCTGAITDRLLNSLRGAKNIKDITLIANDFTKIFTTPEVYRAFTKKGATIEVLRRPELIAVCINPTSPDGVTLNSQTLQQELQNALQIPVYDIRRI